MAGMIRLVYKHTARKMYSNKINPRGMAALTSGRYMHPENLTFGGKGQNLS